MKILRKLFWNFTRNINLLNSSNTLYFCNRLCINHSTFSISSFTSIRSTIIPVSSFRDQCDFRTRIPIGSCLNVFPSSQLTQIRNAGHAKWQNIKHIKELNDSIRQKERARIGLQIKQAIRFGGSNDPKLNKQLSNAIQIARNAQVPAEAIQRLLSADNKQGKDMKVVPYALKGPSQSILIAEIETDNFTRTKQELASIVKKRMFSVVDLNSILHQFKHVGIILCSEINGKKIGKEDLDQATEHALEVGAEDVTLIEGNDEQNSILEFITDPSPNVFNPALNSLLKLNYKIISSETEYISLQPVSLNEKELEIVGVMHEKLLSLDSIVKVYDNLDQ